MKAIQDLVDMIDEEIEGARCYAEMYLQLKAEDGQSEMSNKFKSMAEDEIKHSNYLHDYAVQKINKLREVYTPPVEMEDKWNESHKKYIEDASWIKMMLSM